MHEDASDAARDTRCLLYARVSTKKQQEAGDLDRQLGRLTALAAEQRRAVVAALTDVASGLNEKRRGLHRLLDLAQQHHADIVAVDKGGDIYRQWGQLGGQHILQRQGEVRGR